MNQNNIYDVIIVGGGISGVYAALNLNKNLKVLICEANKEMLVKFKLTGNGSANMTNLSNLNELLNNTIYGTKKFMYYGFKNYGPDKIIEFMKKHHLKFYQRQDTTKIFLSEPNSNAINKFNWLLKQNKNINVITNTRITKVSKQQDIFSLNSKDNKIFKAKNVIIATGGLSFQKLGFCNGDGYNIAKQFNHNISKTFPMGVGIDLNKQLIQFKNQIGIDINNTIFKVLVDNKIIAIESGPLMITHTGLGGPVIKRISSYYSYHLSHQNNPTLVLDLVKESELNDILNKIKKLSELFNYFDYFPKRFISNFYENLKLSNNSDVKNFNKQTKQQIINYFVNIIINDIKTPLNIQAAICTGGGVDTKQLNPNTFMSKLIDDLYFIGEVNDINSLTGGFNLTVCFASAMLCSDSINNKYLKNQKEN